MIGRLFLIAACLAVTTGAGADTVAWRGADVSFLPQIEAGGGVFTDGGEAGDLFGILADHGVNLIRLRLWHTPWDGWCDLEHTLAMARRARDAGQSVLLDLHYSDTWADPAHQFKPAAWAALPFAALVDSVFAYTRDATAAMIAQGTPPAMIQLGNEITPGMLWDDGQVGGAFNTPEQWDRLAQLLDAGVAGVEDAFAPAPRPPIMIHSDRGGDNGGCRWFFGNVIAEGVDFDVIGLSYYPWWHGDLAVLEANVDDLAARYGKDVMVVETAYPWTLDWFDDVHNTVGLPEQLLPGYPDTPAGQRAFLDAVFGIVAGIPYERGLGVVYWAPERISTQGFGSSGENLALFDETGEVLPGLGAFTPVTEVATPVATGLVLTRADAASEGGVTFRAVADRSRDAEIDVYDARGRRLAHVWSGQLGPEGREILWRPERPLAGPLLVRLVAGSDSVTLGLDGAR